MWLIIMKMTSNQRRGGKGLHTGFQNPEAHIRRSADKQHFPLKKAEANDCNFLEIDADVSGLVSIFISRKEVTVFYFILWSLRKRKKTRSRKICVMHSPSA